MQKERRVSERRKGLRNRRRRERRWWGRTGRWVRDSRWKMKLHSGQILQIIQDSQRFCRFVSSLVESPAHTLTHTHTPSNCTHSHPHYLNLGFFGKDEARHFHTSCDGGGRKCEIKRTWVGGWVGGKAENEQRLITITVLKSCEILFYLGYGELPHSVV